jgi:hypothetical protein
MTQRCTTPPEVGKNPPVPRGETCKRRVFGAKAAIGSIPLPETRRTASFRPLFALSHFSIPLLPTDA